MTTPEILYRATGEHSTIEAHLYQLQDGRYGVRMFDTEAGTYYPFARLFRRLDAATAYADAAYDAWRPRIPGGWDVVETSHN